jgi:hypothetical protein
VRPAPDKCDGVVALFLQFAARSYRLAAEEKFMKRFCLVLMSLLAVSVVAQPIAFTPKQPSYVICGPTGVTIYPSNRFVPFLELTESGIVFEKFLDQLEADKYSRYLVILVRPKSAKVYRTVLSMIRNRPIDTVKEPVDADFKLGADGYGLTEPHQRISDAKGISDKQTVFFECRNNEVFFIDKDYFDDQVAKLLSSLKPEVRTRDLKTFLKAVQGHEFTNEYYKVNKSYLSVAVIAYEPQPDIHGELTKEIETPDSKFQKTLAGLNSQRQYVVFLIRDDSFAVFRRARSLAEQNIFKSGGNYWSQKNCLNTR